jgi:hypothetical protein
MAQSTTGRAAASYPVEARPTALPLNVGLLPSHANDRVDGQGREQNQEAQLLNFGGHAELLVCGEPASRHPLHVGARASAREDQLGGSSL